jgi:hypothetical protein
MQKAKSNYSKDIYKWTIDQVKYLNSKDFNKIDVENIIEEIKSLGTKEKHAIYSHLIILLMHLLKKEYQPSKKSKSWDRSIFNSKVEIEWQLKYSPSLKNYMKDVFDDAYQKARKKAALETSLDIDIFPKKCPWTIKEILKD